MKFFAGADLDHNWDSVPVALNQRQRPINAHRMIAAAFGLEKGFGHFAQPTVFTCVEVELSHAVQLSTQSTSKHCAQICVI